MKFMSTQHYQILLTLILSGTLAVTGCGPDSNGDNNDNNGTPDAGSTDTGNPDSGEDQDIGEQEDPEILPDLIGEDTVLTNIVSDPDQPDYIAENNVKVSAKLVIEAGVVIQFAPDTALTVDGRSDGILDAQGTQAEPVLLTGELKEKGSWRGVYIDNVEASQNRLNWTIIEYGGGSEIGSGLGASNLGIGGFVGISTMGITNSTFRHSAGFGVEVEGVSGFAAFENNTFEDNDDYALSLGANQRGKVDPQTTFVGEGPDAGVNIHGGSVSTDQTWQNLKDGAITSVTDHINVQAQLEIEPGVTLHFGDNRGMTVDGRDDGILVANGTSEDPIVMTRLGGVIWKGLYFDNSNVSANNMEFVTIDHAGFSAFEGDHNAALSIGGFVGTTAVEVRDCMFSNSSGAGIYIESDSVDTVNSDVDTANTFVDNAGPDVLTP